MALARPVRLERQRAGVKRHRSTMRLSIGESVPTSGGYITVEPQGVQFAVDTTGYSNITFQFDWNQGGISDMQPQYLARWREDLD